MDLQERVKIAYKKLKASTYFDKTLLPLRDQIVAYESEGIDCHLSEIVCKLNAPEAEWNTFLESILSTISVLVFPKSLQSISDDTVIFNNDNTPIQLDKPQYFIDLPVNGHILGVLWVLSVGKMLDQNSDHEGGMYEHSYGNRLKKNLVNQESHDITYSPHLFEPYFSQYESWRDHALKCAGERLNDKQDTIILTLDLKSFYYGVDLRETDFSAFLEQMEDSDLWIIRVNDFIYRVLRRYSDKLRLLCEGTELSVGNRTLLPIGFFPSNILANWVLTPFDNAIIEFWNPVYYGRYVDDIIIVDKVEKNSSLYKKAREKDPNRRLDAKEVIEMFLINSRKSAFPILQYDTKKSKEITYRINPTLLCSENCHLCIQNSKVKIFYFQSGSSQALLNCFQKSIAKNVSEFRLMPDIDNVLKEKDYSEVFNLRHSDSINKLRSVDGIYIDKFAMSKFLGKYRKVSSLINDKKEETAFEKDLMLILDERTLIENYSAWERVLEILAVNNRTELLKKCSLRILSAIARYEVPQEKVHSSSLCVKDGLLRVFRSALCRVSALAFGNEIDDIIEAVCNEFSRQALDLGSAIDSFEPSKMRQDRLHYCQSRMVNKYVLPLPIDCVLEQLDGKETKANLCELSDSVRLMDIRWLDHTYRYYPYVFTPQEISFAMLCQDVFLGIKDRPLNEQLDILKREYLSRNYPNVFSEHPVYELAEIQVEAFPLGHESKHQVVYIAQKDNTEKTDRLCVAIGNAELKLDNFKVALNGKPNRKYARYRDLSKMLDAAIEQRVDLLVLPENYLPLEWIPTVSRFCANNQMGLVTGIEHIVSAKSGTDKPDVYNLTAVILPYIHDGHEFAHVVYHSKVKFSPEEERQIEGYHCTCHKGNEYQLFCWRDIWFPVYCCYELASIHDRALFRSYADMVIAVEWNHDINYFSSIIESMCRDLHCYCIQANSSGPGDSRVLQPSRQELRDIIKTKGGKNPCILATDIDIKALREFQNLHHSLQKDSNLFKPTPPDFDLKILKEKQKSTLFEWIKEQNNA